MKPVPPEETCTVRHGKFWIPEGKRPVPDCTVMSIPFPNWPCQFSLSNSEYLWTHYHILSHCLRTKSGVDFIWMLPSMELLITKPLELISTFQGQQMVKQCLKTIQSGLLLAITLNHVSGVPISQIKLGEYISTRVGSGWQHTKRSIQVNPGQAGRRKFPIIGSVLL